MPNGLHKYSQIFTHLKEKSEVVKAGESFLLSTNISDAIVQHWQPLLTDPSIPGAAFLSRISPFMAPHSRIFKAAFQENPSHKKIPLLMSWWSRGVKLLFLSHCVLWEMDVSVGWMGSISTRPQHRPAALQNDSMSLCPLCWEVRHCGELEETGNASSQGVPNWKTYLPVLNNTLQYCMRTALRMRLCGLSKCWTKGKLLNDVNSSLGPLWICDVFCNYINIS